MAERDFRWRPDVNKPHEYPPPGADFGPGHDPGDADDPIKALAATYNADDLGNEPVLWPAAADLTDEARRELRRCATAFENEARRLREIVGQ